MPFIAVFSNFSINASYLTVPGICWPSGRWSEQGYGLSRARSCFWRVQPYTTNCKGGKDRKMRHPEIEKLAGCEQKKPALF
jgi:hypothetical protein